MMEQGYNAKAATETKTILGTTTQVASKSSPDCERLLSRSRDATQRLEVQVERLSKVISRLYAQPPDEASSKQPRGDGWVEDIDGALDTIDILIVSLGTDLDQLNRFME